MVLSMPQILPPTNPSVSNSIKDTEVTQIPSGMQDFTSPILWISATPPSQTIPWGLSIYTESASVSSNQTWGIFDIDYPDSQNLNQLHYQTYPTVWDSLLSAGYIARRLFSLYLDDVSSSTGSVLFGGIDTIKYPGELVSFPIQ